MSPTSYQTAPPRNSIVTYAATKFNQWGCALSHSVPPLGEIYCYSVLYRPQPLHGRDPLDVNSTGDTLGLGSFMKTLAMSGLVLLAVSGAFAQRHGVGTTFGTNAGYGNVVFPGGKPAISTPFLNSPNFARSLGNVVAGRPAFNGTVRHNNAGSVVYVPYAYPVYMGGY